MEEYLDKLFTPEIQAEKQENVPLAIEPEPVLTNYGRHGSQIENGRKPGVPVQQYGTQRITVLEPVLRRGQEALLLPLDNGGSQGSAGIVTMNDLFPPHGDAILPGKGFDKSDQIMIQNGNTTLH